MNKHPYSESVNMLIKGHHDAAGHLSSEKALVAYRVIFRVFQKDKDDRTLYSKNICD